jgi:aspartate-semialdehyde dehydrogenase
LRVAVVGATSDDGSRVREQLARAGVPGERVELFGRTSGEVVLSEYDGEARIVQEPDPSLIAEHDLIFVCDADPVGRRVLASAPPRALVIDLTGGAATGREAPRFHSKLRPASRPSESGGRWAVPHALALLLAELLDTLTPLGLEEAFAVVLRPASDFGEPGLEELREQTVRLLNFESVPVEVFGQQLAFNVVPQSRVAAAEPDLEGRIAAEVAELLGWTRRRLGLKLLTVPVFYGHGLQLRIRLAAGVGLPALREALDSGGWLPDDLAPCTPLETVGEAQAWVAEMAEDGLDGFWLWVVAGETAGRNAQQAVQLAQAVCDL